jgi:hypothetical protein
MSGKEEFIKGFCQAFVRSIQKSCHLYGFRCFFMICSCFSRTKFLKMFQILLCHFFFLTWKQLCSNSLNLYWIDNGCSWMFPNLCRLEIRMFIGKKTFFAINFESGSFLLKYSKSKPRHRHLCPHLRTKRDPDSTPNPWVHGFDVVFSFPP